MPTQERPHRRFLSSDAPDVHVFPGAAHVAYKIGGLAFGLTGEDGLCLALDQELSAFRTIANSYDVDLKVAFVDSLEVPRSQLLFDSGGLWSLFAENGGYRFSFLAPMVGITPYKEAWLDSKFQRGRILLSKRYFDEERPVYPLEYPLDELLMIHRLSYGAGVEVHAVGISDEQCRGHLFIGHSGAGKSTTARLWMRRPGVRILSDDRIILRAEHGQIWMYGTPWHGDAGVASPDCAPLTGIYLLEKGKRNEKLRLATGPAAAQLFARCFVPHHSKDAIRATLDFVDQVASLVPCSIFRFLPDATAVEAIGRG